MKLITAYWYWAIVCNILQTVEKMLISLQMMLISSIQSLQDGINVYRQQRIDKRTLSQAHQGVQQRKYTTLLLHWKSCLEMEFSTTGSSVCSISERLKRSPDKDTKHEDGLLQGLLIRWAAMPTSIQPGLISISLKWASKFCTELPLRHMHWETLYLYSLQYIV